MPSVISGDANVSATEFGFLDGVTSALQTQIDSKLPIAGGKILQIVRATDSTDRSTTSATFVDASISVTITPQKSDSAILLINTCGLLLQSTSGATVAGNLQITDSSNNPISGAENLSLFFNTTDGTIRQLPVIWGYATPATTSAVTYKIRFTTGGSNRTVTIANALSTGQMYAIEVSA